MADYGFIKVAAAAPKVRIGDPRWNIGEIGRLIEQADQAGAALAVFPELCVTGYTCADLFLQQVLLDEAVVCLESLLKQTAGTNLAAIVGMPLLLDQVLYNCAVVFQRGEVLGVVPKMFIPNYKEFYEKRWFASGRGVGDKPREIDLLGKTLPFGDLLFRSNRPGFTLGVEICEDLWSTIPPSSYQALSGATVIANLSASNELVSKSNYRRQLILQQSARCLCGYIYASAGVHESTTDVVFGGDCVIAENGSLLGASERFSRESTLTYAEIDVDRMGSERQLSSTFADSRLFAPGRPHFQTVDLLFTKDYDVTDANFSRSVPSHPFIPDDPKTRDERCEEIFNIQVAGLAKRLEGAGLHQVVLGISGGLDSTLALLVCVRTFKLLGLDPGKIMTVTMPGFGTTDQTYGNALQLMKSLQTEIREIDIKAACLQHFRDIGHDPDVFDVTYENVQARERTQILMDLANKHNGIVIGTGDLSELALGWCTFNGDHMAMYSVNCGVPKTLVRYLVKWVADHIADSRTRNVLEAILDTPISPELLPPDAEGRIKQKTEDVVGPYELHDFFLYYGIRFGMPPRKVLFLAKLAFRDRYPQAELVKWLKAFYLRFFRQQFKRSALPDGPKVGMISLSPRGDWRMPSDADPSLWLRDLEELS